VLCSHNSALLDTPAAVYWYPPLTVCSPVTQNTDRLPNTYNFRTVRTNNANFVRQWNNSWLLDRRKHRTHFHLLPFLNSHHHAKNTNNVKVRYAEMCIKSFFPAALRPNADHGFLIL
jgi:hypothetical protein